MNVSSEGFGAELQLPTIVLAFQWGHLNFSLWRLKLLKLPGIFRALLFTKHLHMVSV